MIHPAIKRTAAVLPISDKDLKTIGEALNALDSGKRLQESELFKKLYPDIVRTLARNVPQKRILAELERLGLKLHPARFKALLQAEATTLSERGDRVCCDRCGSVLPPPVEQPANAVATMSGTTDMSGGARSHAAHEAA